MIKNGILPPDHRWKGKTGQEWFADAFTHDPENMADDFLRAIEENRQAISSEGFEVLPASWLEYARSRWPLYFVRVTQYNEDHSRTYIDLEVIISRECAA